MWGMKPRILRMACECSSTELHALSKEEKNFLKEKNYLLLSSTKPIRFQCNLSCSIKLKLLISHLYSSADRSRDYIIFEFF